MSEKSEQQCLFDQHVWDVGEEPDEPIIEHPNRKVTVNLQARECMFCQRKECRMFGCRWVTFEEFKEITSNAKSLIDYAKEKRNG